MKAWTNVLYVLVTLAFGVDIVLPHSWSRSPPLLAEPTLIVKVIYDRCSGIANGVLSQVAIAP